MDSTLALEPFESQGARAAKRYVNGNLVEREKTPTRRQALGRLPTPPPSARKSATQTAQKTALCTPCEHPGGFGIRGSRSRPPLPLRFERLRVPVWNPYSRGRLSHAKSQDRKGGEGKTDANLTIFLAPTPFSQLFQPRPTAKPQQPEASNNNPENTPCEHPGGFGIRKSASNSGHSPLRGSG